METTGIKDKNSILTDLIKRADVLTEKVQELKDAENELEQINQAITALGGKVANTLTTMSNNIINGFNTTYNSSMSWPEKVKYAVRILGHATTQEIIKELRNIDSDLRKDDSKLLNNVTTTASTLALKGDLVAYKDGVRNIYSLPKK